MAGSGQRAHGQSSGGMRIDDHAFWAGKGHEGSVFPMGAKHKMERSADGAGEVMKYLDTTEEIRADQESREKAVKRHQGRLPEHRN